MNLEWKNRCVLALVFLALVLLVYIKSVAHLRHYCTPDSYAYLAHARFITEAQFLNLKGTFTTWPVGYSALIAFTSKLTGLSLLWSSKTVNLLFFMGLLFIMKAWFKDKFSFVVLAFLTYGTLELVSFSWSETAFLFFVFLFIHSLSHQEKRGSSLLFFVALIGLFLTKYLGLVFYGFAFLYFLKEIVRHGWRNTQNYMVVFFLASAFALLYLGHNYLIDGYFTGEPRFYFGSADGLVTFKAIVDGLTNELFLARKMYLFRPDGLFVTLLFVQIALISFLFFKKKFIKVASSFTRKESFLLWIGGFYLVSIVLLRLFIPLYDFNYRLLSPFSLPVLVALLSFYSRQKAWFKSTRIFVIAFFILIYFFSFPKTYLLTQFGLM